MMGRTTTLVAGAALLGCTMPNPAFDSMAGGGSSDVEESGDELAEGEEASTGDGDGDPTTTTTTTTGRCRAALAAGPTD